MQFDNRAEMFSQKIQKIYFFCKVISNEIDPLYT